MMAIAAPTEAVIKSPSRHHRTAGADGEGDRRAERVRSSRRASISHNGERTPPMPLPPTLPLPTALQTALWIRRPTRLLEFCSRRYGDVFTLKLPQGNIVLVSDPASIKQIFTGDPETFRAGEVNLILEPVVGESSVLTLDGKAHLRQRKLMLPPFHGERMRLYASTMQRITEDTMASWPEDQVFALHPHAQHITLEVILRTVFGVDERARLEELRAALNRLLSNAGSSRAVMLLIPALQRDLGPFTPYRRFRQHLDSADALIHRQIAHRRRQNGEPRRDDVLALLLDARDEQGQPLSDGELRDELVTLLLAGHETTATALCWAFERVSGNASSLPSDLRRARKRALLAQSSRPITCHGSNTSRRRSPRCCGCVPWCRWSAASCALR